jgi:hypothetical protein
VWVGGIILHFWMRAMHPELFPFAGRLILLVGMGLVVLVTILAGRRMAIRFGAVTLAIGVVMLVFGFVKLADPSLRFLAPLGFFICLTGGSFLWCGRVLDGDIADIIEAPELPGSEVEVAATDRSRL